jgi:hypothetical protein
MLVGTSRKSFIGKLLGDAPAGERVIRVARNGRDSGLEWSEDRPRSRREADAEAVKLADAIMGQL